MKPLLPSADRLLPYLQRIDDTRHYTNFGELNAEYQSRISELFECPCVTGSSATSLITASLMALDLPRGSLVAMPSYTFPATAAAVVSAGLVPYFVDALGVCGSQFIDMPKIPLDKVSAIIVVSPFGKAIPSFNKIDLGVPIIIDAAAGFDVFSTVCRPGKTPVIVSTHATKAFATGEGGLLLAKDTDFLEKVRRITNFGLTPDRRIEYTGLNAKFSEYHAAVGLAELDGWADKRERLLSKLKPYGVNYAITQVPVPIAQYPDAKQKIYGCHIHDAYKNFPRAELPVTEELIRTIGTIGIEL